MASVDVIIPCYRYGHFLKQCVDSVLSQGPLVRALIIDDASPDNSAEVADQIAKSNSRVTFIRHTVNRGHINTYNEGIEWVSADYMLLLSADDYLLPGALNRATDLMDANPQVGFTYGNAHELQDNVKGEVIIAAPRVLNTKIITGGEFIRSSGAHNVVRSPTAVVRTELQKKLGGYRTELPHTGDMEMWFRIAARASVGIIDAYQAVYRVHFGNMTGQYLTKSALPDLKQKKAALDYFFQTSGPGLPNAEELRQTLYESLAQISVGRAISAFDQGETALSNEISDFAVSVSPQITRTLSWAKFVCRQGLGLKTWRALSFPIRKLRGRA